MLLLPQFIGSLALVIFLSSLYGVARRHMRMARAQTVLGLAFGLVAMLQMSAPIEMMPGIILDMRNVPIALAGAFLGWRGAALCLVMAIMTRASIGGVGMVSGIAGMVIACAVGQIWSRATRGLDRRSVAQLVALGGIVSAHMVTAILLPAEAAAAFMATAALPMAVLNLLSVPIAAAFLEQERVRMIAEDEAIATRPFHPANGLARLGHFRREATALARSDCNGHIAGLLTIEIQGAAALRRAVGLPTYDQMLAAMRLRLAPFLMPDMPPVALAEDGRLILPLDFRQVAERDEVETRIRRILTEQAYQIGSATPLRIGVAVLACPAPTVEELEQLLTDIALRRAPVSDAPDTRVGWLRRRARSAPGQSLPPARRDVRHDRLFAAANVLLATKDS